MRETHFDREVEEGTVSRVLLSSRSRGVKSSHGRATRTEGTRRTPRYETAIHCTLEATGTGTWVGGVITDLSLGGAGIDVLGKAPREFVLVFVHEGESLRLPCTTRLLRDLWNRRRVHAQFQPLSARQQESLGRVVGGLCDREPSPTAKRSASLVALARLSRR